MADLWSSTDSLRIDRRLVVVLSFSLAIVDLSNEFVTEAFEPWCVCEQQTNECSFVPHFDRTCACIHIVARIV